MTLYVNRLNTEESIIPYEYHHFDFCTVNEQNSPVENLGQVVFGERIRPSPYKIEFLKDVECETVSLIFTEFFIFLWRISKYLLFFTYVFSLKSRLKLKMLH